MAARAYRYRLYPNTSQRELLARTFGCVRQVWNHNVEVFNSYDRDTNSRPVPLTSTQLRNHPDHEYMLEVSAAALQQKENDFKEFRKQFFMKGRKKKLGRPKFHGKYGHQAYRLPSGKFAVGHDSIRLERIGHVDAVIHRHVPAGSKLVSVTVSRDTCGDYFASVLVEEDIKPRFERTGKTVGIDVGLKTFATLSTGESIENPRWLRENQAQLRQAQKHLCRKRKGSVRREKCKLVVARLNRKVARQRRWFHHNLSLHLVRAFDTISVESLNIAGMLKNRYLARSISDAGWCQFLSMLRYKAEWNQREHVPVSMWFPSSRECACGVRNHKLKLSHRQWTCAACGAVHHRDQHAAVKIDVEGLRLLALVKAAAAQSQAGASAPAEARGVERAQRTQRRCKPETTSRRLPVKRVKGDRE